MVKPNPTPTSTTQAPAETRPLPKPTEKPIPKPVSGRFASEIQETTRDLAEGKASYAIAFIVACEPTTILDLQKVGEPFGLLPRKIGQRDCFIGIWGQFSSKEAAIAGLNDVPVSLSQGEKGWVLDVRPFLKP